MHGGGPIRKFRPILSVKSFRDDVWIASLALLSNELMVFHEAVREYISEDK
jgi:hypothetical protein